MLQAFITRESWIDYVVFKDQIREHVTLGNQRNNQPIAQESQDIDPKVTNADVEVAEAEAKVTNADVEVAEAEAKVDFPRAKLKPTLSLKFLELSLDLAAENDIQWVFVRSQLRPYEDGSLRDSLPSEYTEDLEEWLTSRGAIYLDLSERNDIPEEWFSDDHHMFGSEPEYTEWFYREFKDQFFK